MVDFDQVKIDCIGKWEGILAGEGIDLHSGKHGPCPICEGDDRFRFDDKEGRGTYFCSGCGAGDGLSLLMKARNMEFKQAMEHLAGVVGTIDKGTVQAEKPVSPDKLREVYRKSSPMAHMDPAWAYMKNRGLSMNHIPNDVRYCQALWEPDTKAEHPAMVSVFKAADGSGVTMHRIWLDKNNNKLDIDKPKKVMPPVQKMAGGAVRLYPLPIGDEYNNPHVLGIAEGVETALAVYEMQYLTREDKPAYPVWAVLSIALMKSFEPPMGIKHLVIWADHDRNYAGQAAAYSLAHRLRMQTDIDVTVELPIRAGCDWLDEWVRNSGGGE